MTVAERLALHLRVLGASEEYIIRVLLDLFVISRIAAEDWKQK
jgi:hypothetical protein